MICAFTLFTGVDSLKKKTTNNPQTPNHTHRQNQHQFISPNPPPQTSSPRKSFPRTEITGPNSATPAIPEIQRDNCSEVQKVSLPLKQASSVPPDHTVVATELTLLQKQMSTD